MKVLFLDIDGVLNISGGYTFSKAACKNFNLLLEQEPDLKIVISSSWRHQGIKAVKNVLKINGVDPKNVIDITGNEHGPRGVQVQAWLDKHTETTGFVVLDDEPGFSNMLSNVVKPNPYIGLTKYDISKALDILKKTR